MNKSRERIDYKRIERLYGDYKSIAVRSLQDATGLWADLKSPISLEQAAETKATHFQLLVIAEDGREWRPDYRRDELVKPRFDPDKPRTYISGRLMLRFLDDGDTPLIVEYRCSPGDVVTGTYHCVTCEGDVEGHPLSEKHAEWLRSFEDEAEAWYGRKRVLGQ